jgi:hypothetical protein
VRIFALGAEFRAALFTDEHAILAFILITNFAFAEMTPFGEVVTLSAPSLANLGHFAVCALLFGASRNWYCLLFGASRHSSTCFSKSRTVILTKATT